MSNKTEWTEEDLMYVFNNYLNNYTRWTDDNDCCIKETNHSMGSIKLMLINVASSKGIEKYTNMCKGNPLYERVADSFISKNNMSVNLFIAKFL